MVADGYKNTEIGVIPVEWDVDKLENLTTKIGDGLHGTPKYVEQSDYYFINGNNLNGESIELTENTKCVSEEEYIKNKKILDDTTVLLSINGTIGSLAYYSAETVMLGKSVAYINSNNKISKQFLFYILKSSQVLNYFLLELTGTTIKNLSLKTIRNTKIPLPPLKEQEKIADILSTADDKIDAIATQIEKTETLKKGLLQKLLNEGIGHSKFKDSELGKIPEHWKVAKLKNITNKITDGSHFSPIPMKNTGYMIATVKDMTNNKFDYNSCVNISNEEFNSLKANGCMPTINDVLFSKDGTIGKTFVFQDKLELVLLSSIAIIRPKDKILNSFYLVQVLKSNIFYKQLKGLSSGSALKRLVLKAIKDIKIPLPPLEEQKQIDDILSIIDKKLEILRTKKEKYETLKKGLLQKLLSGEIRVDHE